ncbi:ABC transporter ATP-binding protein/permease [Paraburkholderia sp. BCC1885]|uniref:ABC transporter ATP-binding protein/permease n=1 Tax=Paraburkholderia sp. BCC1885 TaxID=2562669 RepID=UPI001183582F|nr:ABC transporter ATP-binding protein/permease [Paraburkholderia sp. BCC1885]
MIKQNPTVVPQPATLKAWWALLRPYWTSDRKRGAMALFATLLILTFSLTYVRLALTVWMGHYQQTVIKYDAAAVPSLLLGFLAILGLDIGVNVAVNFVNLALGINWRSWLTKRFLQRWMGGKAFYWIEQEQLVDNPDQRITEDIDQFVTASLTLSLGLFGTATQLVVFTKVLWIKSGPLAFSLFGSVIQVPHYMVWLAIVYALITSFIVQFAGRRLQPLTFQKQQAEANFRFTMTGVREHVEQIALLGGGPMEIERAGQAFDKVRSNFWRILMFNLRFEPVTLGIAFVSGSFASFALLPRYLNHQISFGDMTQLAATFGLVAASLQWFIHNFVALQQYRVVVSRLAGLDGAINLGGHPRGPHYDRSVSDAISVSDLDLQTPQGRTLVSGLTLTLRPGERWMVSGPSGAGKSTLLRALAGIWHYGAGQVTLPANAKLFFLPQKNYIPPGTFRAALCYPAQPHAFDDETCRRALIDCQLGQYSDVLDEVARWGNNLSPGEQQRLGFARALLQQPDYLLLDESTSALDEDNESKMYQLITQRLPEAAIISVSHHSSLERFHTHALRIENGQAQQTNPIVVA